MRFGGGEQLRSVCLPEVPGFAPCCKTAFAGTEDLSGCIAVGVLLYYRAAVLGGGACQPGDGPGGGGHGAGVPGRGGPRPPGHLAGAGPGRQDRRPGTQTGKPPPQRSGGFYWLMAYK